MRGKPPNFDLPRVGIKSMNKKNRLYTSSVIQSVANNYERFIIQSADIDHQGLYLHNDKIYALVPNLSASLKEELIDSPIKIQVVSPGFINTNVTINSLKPDGSKMNKNSSAQENGMPAKAFAKKLRKVIEGNKFHSYIGRKELMAIPLHSLVPNLFYKLLRNNK